VLSDHRIRYCSSYQGSYLLVQYCTVPGTVSKYHYLCTVRSYSQKSADHRARARTTVGPIYIGTRCCTVRVRTLPAWNRTFLVESVLYRSRVSTEIMFFRTVVLYRYCRSSRFFGTYGGSFPFLISWGINRGGLLAILAPQKQSVVGARTHDLVGVVVGLVGADPSS
jgi:hypothetical protein